MIKRYGKLTTGEFTKGHDITAPSAEWIEMQNDKPLEGDWIAQADGTWAQPAPPTLEETKVTMHASINTLRDSKEQDYFVYDGSAFDADSSSAQRLAMASQTASTALAAGQPFQLAWTLKDNTTRAMTAQDMIEVIPAFAMWSNAVHTYASALKAQVTNSTTVEELNAIDVEAGWPTPEQVAGV